MKTIYNYKTTSKQIFILLLCIANISNNIIAMDKNEKSKITVPFSTPQEAIPMLEAFIALHKSDMEPTHKKQLGDALINEIYERSQRRSQGRDTTRKLHPLFRDYEYTKRIYGEKEADFLFNASHSELEDRLNELEKQDQSRG